MTHSAWSLARALFVAARATGELEAVQQDLELLANLTKDLPVRRFLSHPLIPQADKERLLAPAARSNLTRGLLGPLIAAGGTDLLSEAARGYSVLYLRQSGRARVRLEVARPLSPEAEVVLRTALTRRLGSVPLITVQVDPELIAGVRVRADGLVLDNSLKTNLEAMAAQLKTA